MNIIKKNIPENHYKKGRGEYRPEIIVIHVVEGLQNQAYLEFINTEKSSHYCVSYQGEIWKFVEESDTAFTQGIVDRPTSKIFLEQRRNNPTFNANAISVSIEHEGFGHEDFTSEQYETTARLVKELSERWKIPLDRDHIIRHSEINKGKTCPGVASVEKIIEIAKKPTPEPMTIISKGSIIVERFFVLFSTSSS